MDNYDWMLYFRDGFPALWVFLLLWGFATIFGLVCLGNGMWRGFQREEKQVKMSQIWNTMLKFSMFLFLSGAIIYTILMYMVII